MKKDIVLDGKIAVVTGAAKGIGRGIALRMAIEGATVVLVDIDTKGLEEVKRQIDTAGGTSILYTADVSNISQNKMLVESILKQCSRIDILVNNAGINKGGGILEITEEDALAVFSTNFIGPFFLTQLVVRDMKVQGIKGSILFTSSTHSHITMLHPAYSSSKAAIEMMIKDIALELAVYGIRVNAVAPGAIAIRGEKNRISQHVPLGYSGTPEDIANAMVFLASEKAQYITGQTLIVDGGFSLAHTHYWIQKGKVER